MKNLTILFAFFWWTVEAQNSLTLSEAYRLAEVNAALSQNPPLLENLANLRLQNIGASRLPTLQWNAKATWQNEVFGLPFDFPGVDVHIPHTQVLTNLEAGYLLYDGGLAEARKTVEQARLVVEKQQVVVELNKLKEQVNQYYFGALLLQLQDTSLEVTQKDLAARAEQLAAGVRHGTVLESELKKVQVEQLKISSKMEEVKSDRRAMLSVLGSLIGQDLDEKTRLQLHFPPQYFIPNPPSPTQRPELALFDLQKQQALASSALIDAHWKPKVGVFATAGVGYPDPLNFFDDKLSPYFVGGVQFSWKILDWQQADRERQQLAVQVQVIDNQKKAFEQSLDHLDEKFARDLEKLQSQMALDGEIARLHGEILRQLASQLEHGVATATEYLLQSDAELQARLTMEMRRVQMAQVWAAWQVWRGQL